MRTQLILFLALGGLLSSGTCQICNYQIIEKDSMVTVADTIVIGDKKSFYVKITDTLFNHPYYLTFNLKNESDSTQYTLLGTEGVIRPLAKKMILQPGETQIITYQFRNVREWGGPFSQAGHISSRARTDQEGQNLSPHSTYQWFLVAGIWKYGK
jgi:hypothetical protein